MFLCMQGTDRTSDFVLGCAGILAWWIGIWIRSCCRRIGLSLLIDYGDGWAGI
ncbi:hypothetical protein BDW68DRAFT_162351 [Aspergillus falconensis]